MEMGRFLACIAPQRLYFGINNFYSWIIIMIKFKDSAVLTGFAMSKVVAGKVTSVLMNAAKLIFFLKILLY